MATTTSTDTVPPLLRLVWLASPALPIGAFSYSEGLEAAVEHGHVHDDVSAGQWLSQQLALLARGDMAAIAHGMQAWRDNDEAALMALADWLRTTRDSAEARLQSEQMGQSLLVWLRPQGMVSADQLTRLTRLCTPAGSLACNPADRAAHNPPNSPPRSVPHSPLPSPSHGPLHSAPHGPPHSPHYALVISLALSAIDVPIEQALQAQAFGWAENQVQAALKAVPLGQTAGQRVLARLASEIPQAVATAIATPPERRQLFAPMLSILAARHETQYSRLFRS
ncbi:urease accessory protein UreF [Roseateles sp. YR242]|uniref:urease accessory protein UreF n=1 Tax=Roseateles sp. YR242 TaxID=1855305 RepID=UPI0015A60D4E|nr:urease accessory UreF family protein [Roseateles sp. YR242]